MATTPAATPKFQDPEFRLFPQEETSVKASAAHDGIHFWQFMVAGSVVGMVKHMAMFPVDTVKTHMQAASSCLIKSVSVSGTVHSILHSEGLNALYRGIATMGLGAGHAYAVYFSIYEAYKRCFSTGDPNNSLAHAVSGICATVASNMVLTPMDMVKQRLQLQLGDNPAYCGVLDCVWRVFMEEGLKAFYASYRTTVLMNAPFTAVHFATYEATKRALVEVSPESASDERLVIHATAGAAAGALAAVVTTLLDVVKTQLQCQGVYGCDRFKSDSTGDVIRVIISKNGYKGLMRGWIPRMLFHAPAAAICWSIYEAAKSLFEVVNDKNNSGTVT